MSLTPTPYEALFEFKPAGAPNYALLREAREVLASIPEAQFDLGQIIAEHSIAACGTIACAAGWLALTPRFQALGLTAVPIKSLDFTVYSLAYKGVDTEAQSGYDLAMAPLFNLTLKQAEDLFASRGDSRMDEDLDEDASDQEVFLARIDRLLAAETRAE